MRVPCFQPILMSGLEGQDKPVYDCRFRHGKEVAVLDREDRDPLCFSQDSKAVEAGAPLLFRFVTDSHLGVQWEGDVFG